MKLSLSSTSCGWGGARGGKISRMGPRRHEDRVGNDRPGARGGPPGPPGTGRTGSRRVDSDGRPRATRLASRSGSSRRPRGDVPARVASFAPAERNVKNDRGRGCHAPRARRARQIAARVRASRRAPRQGKSAPVPETSRTSYHARANGRLSGASRSGANRDRANRDGPQRPGARSRSRIPLSKSTGTRDREPARFIAALAFNGHFQTERGSISFESQTQAARTHPRLRLSRLVLSSAVTDSFPLPANLSLAAMSFAGTP